MPGLLSLLVTLIILGLVFYVVIWAIGWIGIGPPFDKVIKAVVALIIVLYLLGLLMGVAPTPLHFWKG